MKHNWIYLHKLMWVNYTTYDVWCLQDVINSSNSHHNIMLLAQSDLNNRPTNEVEFFKYAQVLGTFYTNIIYITGPGSVGHQSQRVEFLWVWWYNIIGARTTGWAHSRLDQLRFLPITWNGTFSFVNPSDVVRGCYILSRFSLGRQYSNREGISYSGKDSKDWAEYYVNRWVPAALRMIYNEVTWNRLVDHDMVMVWDTCIPMAQTSCSLLELHGLCLYSQTMVGLCGLIWVTWGRDRAARPAIGWLGRAGLCAVHLGCKWAVAGLRPIEELTSVTQSNEIGRASCRERVLMPV